MYSNNYTSAPEGFHRTGSILWLAVVLAMWSATWICTPDAIAAENVLLIIADDYGVSSHGLYGYASSSAPTPNLDTLAAQGAVFGNAWVTPMCSPTRARILTGRYGFRTGVGSPGALGPISLDEYTVAQALKTLGYSTGCFGKWHLAGPDNGGNDNPNLMGFDRFAGSRANLGDYFNWSKVADGVTSPCTNYSTTELTDDAIAWINQQGSQPWFCWLAYHAPHAPFHKPPNDLHSYDDLPDTGANTVSYYEAMVEAMDTEIGRLFSSIDPNVLDNTNIVFIGDNGTPGQVIVPPAEQGRAKSTLYQGGVWVPWFMKGPSIPQTDTMITALVESVDLFSTIIELAGGTPEAIVPAEVVLDSRSVMPLLVSPGSGSVRDYAMTEIFRTNPRASDGKAIRNSEYKLIRFDSGGERFYHLASDTWEQNDLLAGTLNTTQQNNYDSMNTLLDRLLSGETGDLGDWRVVDTGQTAFYNNSGEITQPALGEDFYGQDAHYVGPQPSYRDNGDGTITDLVTGLMWQKTPDLLNQSTFIEAAANAYTLDLAGHTDWRLPSLKELYSLIDFRGHIWRTVEESTPYIDTNYFDFVYGDVTAGERIIDAQYWSSTTYVGTTMNNDPTIFGVNFADGRIKGYPFMSPRGEPTHFVRYVRGNTDYGKNNFIDNGDGTVTDIATNLMWQQADSGVGYNWHQALTYAEALDLAGYDDWRLPNAKELQSIVDYKRAPDALQAVQVGPAIDPVFQITNIGTPQDPDYPYFWSGTTHLDGPHNWGVYVTFGQAWGYMEQPPGSGNYRLLNVHGAGAQRSDPKDGDPADWPNGNGPQGDVVRIFNYVRCVRDAIPTN